MDANCGGGEACNGEESGRSMAWASTGALIGGGVSLLAGVTLLAIDLASGDSSGSDRARLVITPCPTPAGLGAHLVF